MPKRGPTLALLLPLAFVALSLLFVACRDGIPVHGDQSAATPIVNLSPDNEPDSSASRTTAADHPREILFFGVSETTQGDRYTFVSFQLDIYGSPCRSASFSVSCGFGGTGGIERQIRIDGLPWLGQSRVTMLFTIDDKLPRAHDVLLHRYRTHLTEGPEHVAIAELDDALWYERLRSASSLTIELVNLDVSIDQVDVALPLKPVTIDLTKLFGTILQDEIDNCGQPSVAAPDG